MKKTKEKRTCWGAEGGPRGFKGNLLLEFGRATFEKKKIKNLFGEQEPPWSIGVDILFQLVLQLENNILRLCRNSAITDLCEHSVLKSYKSNLQKYFKKRTSIRTNNPGSQGNIGLNNIAEGDIEFFSFKINYPSSIWNEHKKAPSSEKAEDKFSGAKTARKAKGEW